MIKKNNWLNDHHNSMETLFNLSYELKDLASAFSLTGNITMAKKLTLISKDIDAVHKIASGAVGASISETLKVSQDHSTLLLKATLAGAFIERNERKKKCLKKPITG